jgi:SAM-dependent methyltransferase
LLKRYWVARALHALFNRQHYQHVWKQLLTATGYNYEYWGRIVYSIEWKKFLESLPGKSLSVLEISPGPRATWKDLGFRSYRAVEYPQFDISAAVLDESFDIIIADNVFEHLRHPYRAARNVRAMLKPSGTLLIATPFLIKVHLHPGDYTRWTGEGLKAFLEDCGFTADVRTWGNRKAASANFDKWLAYGWKRDLKDEPDYPLHVWGYARIRDSEH